MPGGNTILTDLQDTVADRLNADEYFADITVITDRKGSLAEEVQKALGAETVKGGKHGVCVIVQQPVAADANANLPSGPMDIEVGVLVLEHVLLNSGPTGTGKLALDIARRVCRVLKCFYPAGLTTLLMLRKPRAILPAQVEEFPDLYAVQVGVECREQDPANFNKVATPVITMSLGAGTAQISAITCSTAGASIYWTEDGSFPWSGNAEATLWTGASEEVTPGNLVRAVAYKSGSIASDMTTAATS